MINAKEFSKSAWNILISTFINNLGNGMHLIAISKLLFDRTGSIVALGFVLILEQVLTFFVHLLIGPIIDTQNPKRFYVQMEFLRGGLVVLLALLMNTDHALAWIMAMTVVIQIGKPINRAAKFSLPPAVVPPENLNRFNGYANMALQSGALIGTLMAAPILMWSGARSCFVINGLSFIGSALFIQLVRYHHETRTTPAPQTHLLRHATELIYQSWTEIFHIVKDNMSLFWHLVLSSADFVAVSIFSLLLAPMASRLGGSPYWISYMDAAFTIGAILGAPISDRISKKNPVISCVLVGILGQASGFWGLASAASGFEIVVASMFVGIFNTVSWSALITSLQLRTPKSIRGRMATIRHVFTACVTAVLIPVVAHAQSVSLQLACVTAGIVFLLFSGLVAFLSRKVVFGRTLLGAPSP